MTFVIRVLAGFCLLVLAVVPAMAQVRVEPVKPEPAWCGGSYSVTGGLDAKAYHEAAAQSAVPSGTNFADCPAIERPVRGLTGGSVMSVPTYPASPAAQVVFDGERTYQLTIDADGKETRVELPLPAKPEPK
jgi:hypothetical protein